MHVILKVLRVNEYQCFDGLVYDVFSSFYFLLVRSLSVPVPVPSFCTAFSNGRQDVLHEHIGPFFYLYDNLYRTVATQLESTRSSTYVKYIIIVTNCTPKPARYLVSASLTSGLIQLNNLKLDRSNYYRIF